MWLLAVIGFMVGSAVLLDYLHRTCEYCKTPKLSPPRDPFLVEAERDVEALLDERDAESGRSSAGGCDDRR